MKKTIFHFKGFYCLCLAHIINPKLLGHHVHIHPMYVIIALIIGGAWGGLLGMLFAVPVAALIKLQFDRVVKMRVDHKQAKERQYFEGKE